jgi:hypothetical protein
MRLVGEAEQRLSKGLAQPLLLRKAKLLLDARAEGVVLGLGEAKPRQLRRRRIRERPLQNENLGTWAILRKSMSLQKRTKLRLLRQRLRQKPNRRDEADHQQRRRKLRRRRPCPNHLRP